MHILSKVTLGIVILMALFFWYFAMRALKTHEVWREAVQAHKDAIADKKAAVTKLMEGDSEKGQMNMGKLQVALDAALFGRGRAWMESSAQFDRNSGNVIVTINPAQGQPHQIEPKMVLNAFQGVQKVPGAEDPTPGKYVGEFNVTAVDGNRVTLTPSFAPSGEQQKLIEQPRGIWSLYEVMPADTNELFAGRTAQEIEALLPKAPVQQQGETNDDFQIRRNEYLALVQEYKQDNKPINANEPPPPERTAVIVKFVKDQADLTEAAKADLRQIDFGENLVKSGVVMKVDLPTATELVRLGLVQEVERLYQRKLRDYSYILREYQRRLPVVDDQIANLEADLAYLDGANKEAETHLAEVNKQEEALTKELALVTKERDVVTEFQTTLQDRLNKVNAEIARLREDNQRLATQLAQRQLEAAQGSGRSASATAFAAPR